MPRPVPNDGRSKFARYRHNKRARGMKLLRMWVPDPKAPGFAETIKRQAEVLRDAPEEQEVLDEIEAMLAEDGWPE